MYEYEAWAILSENGAISLQPLGADHAIVPHMEAMVLPFHLYYYIGEFGWSTRTSHRTNSGLYSTMSYVCTLGCPYVQDILYKPKSSRMRLQLVLPWDT